MAEVKGNLGYYRNDGKSYGIFLARSCMDKPLGNKEEESRGSEECSVDEELYEGRGNETIVFNTGKDQQVACYHKEQCNILEQVAVDESYAF